MTDLTTAAASPVRPTGRSRLSLAPITRAEITGGLWAERRRINREVSVPAGWDRLHEAGNVHNLELAADRADGDYVNDLPFLDSDVYKWLEALGWTFADPSLTDPDRHRLDEFLTSAVELLAAAQADDGYLDSHFQVRFPGERFVQLQWGHELYCFGHLIQAAVAVRRTSGDDRLLAIARACADLVVRSFGAVDGKVDGVCGHPEIETALVELYRETGEPTYLEMASYFVDRRGHGLLGDGRFGRHYWQDHVPVREADSVEGHAVRQLYLLAGVIDVYTETGDQTLRDAAIRLWREMVATKTYLTGGVGAHHSDEAFGDPYELPNERSYCETCAAIASIMFSWRMLMVTGDASYADLIERTLYNGFLAGISLTGQAYIYANPLQVREGHVSAGNDGDYERRAWFHCACCPPNVMRTLAALEHYVVLASADDIRVHQYVAGNYRAALAGGAVRFRVETDYPWDGRVRLLLDDAPGGAWGLGLRVPHWAAGATLTVNGEPATEAAAEGWWTIRRDWAPGDEVVLDVPLDIRLTKADPRVDADRGCIAVERGPLVYCLEAADNSGVRLDDVIIDPTAEGVADHVGELLGGVTVIRTHGWQQARPQPDWWPYGDEDHTPAGTADAILLTAIPYFAWGNRAPGAMRVWIPAP